MCQQHHPQSSLSLCLSLFSHAAGGWLAQERGIINFLEWQTLDVHWAVLSHPLLGVPQPPSLLPVILHLCVSGFFSPKAIHLLYTLDVQSRVNGRMHLKTHLWFQRHRCTKWPLCTCMYSIWSCLCGAGGRFVNMYIVCVIILDPLTLCVTSFGCYHRCGTCCWAPCLINHKPFAGALTTHNLAYLLPWCVLGRLCPIICS